MPAKCLQFKGDSILFDEETYNQANEIASQKALNNAIIKIMPDAHAGKASCIGFTAIVDNGMVIPNTIGVDIGCMVSAYKIPVNDIDYAKLDNVIRNNVPSGNSIRKTKSSYISEDVFDIVEEFTPDECLDKVEHFKNSIGTLGGGNHFISVEGNEDEKYLLIHCGSRHFGYKICEHFQQLAEARYKERNEQVKKSELEAIEPSKREAYIKQFFIEDIKKDYMYLDGVDATNYLSYMSIAQTYASWNHYAIFNTIFDNMGWNKSHLSIEGNSISTMHNYVEIIDSDKYVIRKGAVSAKENEIFLLPMNMAAGTYICIGKGNPDWNYSAPHGAGRIGSRTSAKKELNMEDFKNSMEGVWSSCVKESTLDESPMAYKNPEFIAESIKETADIIKHLKPFYNFKAS